MTVYLVTGASRGLGYAFVQHLSKDPLNTVIGLVRNKSKTDAQISEDKLNQNSNIHIFSGDITSYKSLLDARAEVEKVTPKIDILINNAAAITVASAFNKLTDFQSDPDLLNSELQTHLTTNVIGVVNTINIFLPLVLKSDIKKVISISTGLADNDFTNNYDLYEAAPYSISKAALNATVAKYNAAHGKNSDRVLFLAIAPGFVATGNDGIRKSHHLRSPPPLFLFSCKD